VRELLPCVEIEFIDNDQEKLSVGQDRPDSIGVLDLDLDQNSTECGQDHEYHNEVHHEPRILPLTHIGPARLIVSRS
jgi:hypothetical protein